MKKVQVNNLIFGESSTKICVPLNGTSDKQILNDIDKLSNYDFDLIELRVDCYKHVENLSKVEFLSSPYFLLLEQKMKVECVNYQKRNILSYTIILLDVSWLI